MNGEIFAKLRKKMGLTQRALSVELDCSVTSISRWELNILKIQKVYELALLKLVADFKESKKKKFYEQPLFKLVTNFKKSKKNGKS